jgi:hypothetical protein
VDTAALPSFTLGHVGRMNMNDLPASIPPMKDDRPPSHRVTLSIELEAHDRRIFKPLEPHISGDNVQIRWPGALLPTRLKYGFEPCLDLFPAVEPAKARRFRNVRVEDRHLFGERAPELIPVEIIERGDKMVEGLINILRRIGVIYGRIVITEYEAEQSE